MRYIDIDKLKDVMGEDAFSEWEALAQGHLAEITNLTKEERSTYFTRNGDWTQLYSHLSKLSNHKCWYSEAPESSGEWEIEHFRPKNLSKDIDGSVLRPDGYWWLAYYWRNYRLAGQLVNKRRKDRFESGDDVYGKGSFFPISKDAGFLADTNDRLCSCEVPLLLDPIKLRDVTLLSFDSNGEVFETYNEDDDFWCNLRAKVSIEFYGLNHTPISRGRRDVWDTCEGIVNKAQEQLKSYSNNPANNLLKDQCIDNCFIDLVKQSQPDKPYSMVVKSFVREKLSDEDFSWLKEVINVLG